ncbi:dihydropteroate synthase [Halocatena salina]|uniref:Probable bifunctional folylpolyglutamate synthase/dihydropteroate synthase n=1 Tax=Halocatena salina TaxID=2934340 RepID=A0A8U0AAB7_9EURY|nr:dihydropteroate synthase [Halocatena salina]UPM44893.1 dihydropteroate synthase [Halocatena salina]
MGYQESVVYLESLQRLRPKLGTETTRRMLSALGRPHTGIDCVQIAGSNGKGSTARMLEQILREAGLDVGVYTSPALTDLRDQIRVNGRKIPKERVQSFVNDIDPCIERLRAEDDIPTYFEVLTTLAIHHFDVEDVDVAILEVGIGGRYDATSAVDPVASAVTSVSLEHTDLLGDTVEAIARDKAQVAPAGAPLVTGADGSALRAIREETDVITVGAEAGDIYAEETGMASMVESSVSIRAVDWSVETNLPLLGQHQATNAGIAATLARQLASVDADTIASGLRGAHWPGRFEIMSTAPLTVLDGSHNPDACSKLATLVERYEFDDLHLVFGAMADKDYATMRSELPAADSVYLCEPAVDRAEAVETLASTFIGHAEDINCSGSVLEATDRALSAAGENDCVLVTGSLYVVAEARDRWTSLLTPKRTDEPMAVPVDSEAHTVTRIQASTDHRTFKTQLRTEQADFVTEALRSAGGSAQTLNEEASDKRVSILLSGLVPQFHELISRIDGAGLGLSHLSEQLERAFDTNPHTDQYPWGDETALIGILNVTPDSFHDGGEYTDVEAAVRRARSMVGAGADIIDIGGESTRPGADPVSAQEEIERVVPVIEELADLNATLSIDTRKATVADVALEAGADIVNDVSGLEDPEMRFVAADHDASLVIMHSLSTPVEPGQTALYDDVVEDVIDELAEQVLLAERAGLDREQIIVDPGCGFGKDPAECFELIGRLKEFQSLGCPVMVGHSQKSMFEHVGCQHGDRLSPTLAMTTLAAERGADIIRVHDVPENAATIRTVEATRAHD